MMQLQRIEAVEWGGGLLFRLHFADGLFGAIDLARELPAGSYAGNIVATAPGGVRIADRGRALVWTDAAGEEVDIDAETLHALLVARREAAE
jgi:hypothetical protein